MTNDTSYSLKNLQINTEVILPPKTLYEHAHIKTLAQYDELYRLSLEDSDRFWLSHAKHLDWFKQPTKACEYVWKTKSRQIEHTWFKDGQLNLSYNCIDRHIKTDLKNKVAIIWQGEQEENVRTLTFEELYHEVARCAFLLRQLGVKKGDRVCIYLPMIPEIAIAVLACARIGAIHSVVFGGFSADSLKDRINDLACKILITANEGVRAGKKILLKEIADEALKNTPSIEKTIVVKHTDKISSMKKGRDIWYHECIPKAAIVDPEVMNAEDPLFILYTSGSTGKPKGVVHTQAGYLLHASLSHKYVFDIQPQDVYWCTADVGWITGHSYVIYGPLANGCTTLMFEGVPTFPNPGAFWRVIEKHKVSVFYTAPTALRSLMVYGDEWPLKYDLSSLRILGSVGETINPKTWNWYHEVVGKKECPIVDTWWQTETGGILISPMPSSHTLKPGSSSKPFFGVDPIILRSNASVCAPNEGGSLCIKRPWPGMMRTVWNAHERFIDTYFNKFDDVYFTGDGCRVDEDEDYWLMGRIDDVVNVSGHRIGIAEVESALVSHEYVAEAAVVPFEHEIKGQGLYAFVTLMDGNFDKGQDLIAMIKNHVRKEIGAIAVPDKVQIALQLPKTRSGKIMRRILRKIASNETDNLGDLSTLADPKVVEKLITERLC